jgi:hypothetical protein
MPKERDFGFTNWSKSLSPSFVVYADIECLLLAPAGVSTTSPDVLQHHQPIAASYLVIPNKDLQELHASNAEFQQQFNHTYKVFMGASQCIPNFLASLEDIVKKMYHWSDAHARKVMRQLTTVEMDEFSKAKRCLMCQKEFTVSKKEEEEEGNDKEEPNNRFKVHDHCHLTGLYRGAACQLCNTRARLRRNMVPVIFHNFKGYDAHHIVKEGVATRPHWNLSVIATTSESYLSLRAQFSAHCVSKL